MCCSVFACGGEQPASERAPAPERAASPRSVVFLSIDTLRADHVSRNGHVRPTTPYLDRLAREGVYFPQCYAQCSWTLPSMLSMFSSLPPPVFGITEGIKAMPAHMRRVPDGKDVQDVLAERFSDEHVMLTEVLADHGYATAGFSTNGHLGVDQGFAQGFEDYDRGSCLWGTADCVYELAGAWLDEHLEQHVDEPFFLWVHLFDPHFTEFGDPPIYAAPPGYEELFAEEDSDSLTVEERTRLAYDRRIRFADDQTERFLEDLRARGVLDEVLLVVAADHGEEFNEVGRWGHSRAVTNTLVHVPLLFRFPQGRWSGVFEELVSNMDIAPTVLDYLGLEVPRAMEGQSLLASIQGERFVPRPVYGDTRRFGLDLRFLIDPETDRKLVLDVASGESQLFSVTGDGAERQDLVTAEPGVADAMEAALIDEIGAMVERSTRSEGQQTMSSEEYEMLRSLGYIR